MAISEARRFLLESRAYDLWADMREDAHERNQSAPQSTNVEEHWKTPGIAVGEAREVDLMMEDDSDNPEALYAELEKETGVKFEVEVDRDPDGEVFGVFVGRSEDSTIVTIRDQEELDYVLAKVMVIAS